MNETFWNKGYMQEALKEIIANAFEVTAFLSVAFTIDNGNIKFQYIIKKLGFEYVKAISGDINKITSELLADSHYFVLDLKPISRTSSF